MAAHQYWRITVTSSGPSGVAVSTVEMRASSGGPNLSVPGNGSASASASDSPYGVPEGAFDGDDQTNWYRSGPPPQWLQWSFTAPTEIAEIVLRHGSGINADFRGRGGIVQYSDNGVDFTIWSPFVLDSANGSSVTVVEVPPAVAVVDVALPMLSIEAFSGANAVLALPMMTVSLYGGVNAHMALPMPRPAIYGGGAVAITMPLMSARAVGGPGVLAGAQLQLPRLVMSAAGGGSARLTLPMLTLETEATFPLVGVSSLTLPALAVVASGRTGGLAAVDVVLPMLTLSGRFGGAAAMVLPRMSVAAGGIGGGVARAALALPMFSLEAVSVAVGRGTADLTLPMLQMAGLAKAVLVLPGLQVVAIGGPVLPVVYEAYAVNLVQSKDGQPYEVTEYTNFPFTKIVRLRDSYYGVGADGLYLLGGDEDLGEPIAWAWQTHLSDFGTKLLKTPDAMYLTGRMGPSACAMVAVGEKRTFTYQMRNWRGEFAQAYRVKMGKGIKATYLGFGAHDECGSVMDVDLLDPRIVSMTRNI